MNNPSEPGGDRLDFSGDVKTRAFFYPNILSSEDWIILSGDFRAVALWIGLVGVLSMNSMSEFASNSFSVSI